MRKDMKINEVDTYLKTVQRLNDQITPFMTPNEIQFLLLHYFDGSAVVGKLDTWFWQVGNFGYAHGPFGYHEYIVHL
jgi:hypothetical protein